MPRDSAPEKWECKQHTIVKHILLEKYLTAWIPILGKRNPTICYFDGFAGRGEYDDGTLGSPIIALRVADKLAPYFRKLFCFFIEKDKDNFANLENLLDLEKSNLKNAPKIEIRKENDEFANVTKKTFHDLRESKCILAPSFFFIDPFGVSGVPFRIVKEILSNPKTEVFFTFMVSYMTRFIKVPGFERPLTELLGTEEWKSIIGSPDREKALIELYRKQLHEVGAAKYSWPFRMSETKRLRTKYYLVHATNNFKGHDIMKGVMYNESGGSFAYLGPKDLFEKSQLKLFDIKDIGQLKHYLTNRFRGRTISYDKIKEEVCEPWYEEPPYIDKHYRDALKELEKEGKIRVKRVTSKTQKGLSGKDMITFPENNPIQTSLSVPVTTTAPKVKIHYREYQQLHETKRILVHRVNDGSIIMRFDKTPLPEKQTDIVCPHFLELKWAYGCPHDCAWCYLKGTFRFHPSKTSPVLKPLEKTELHTRAFLEQVKTPEILNTGEIADSLMFEHPDVPFSKFIIPIFQTQKLHKVLFLTKSSNVGNLLEIDRHDQAIISFSLNALPVAKKWEKAPPVLKRIEAARKVQEAGYEVRIRIDPMVPMDNWEEHYLQLLDVIFENLKPERVTLGSLRGLQSTINGCTDKSWVKYLKESSNWGKKIDFQTRLAMYSAIIRQLRDKYDYDRVALCKESIEMWDSLDMDYHRIRCNCIW